MFAYALIHEKYSWIIGCDNVSNILRQIETCDVSIFNDNNNNNILTQIEKTYVQIHIVPLHVFIVVGLDPTFVTTLCLITII